MKTRNDHTSNPKGSSTQSDRSGSNPNRGGGATDKDGKQATPAKLAPTDDSPKIAADIREKGTASAAAAKPAGSTDTKHAGSRSDSYRKST
jgi:hypothetical protein